MERTSKFTKVLRASVVLMLGAVLASAAFACVMAFAPATANAETLTYEEGVADDVTTLTVSKRDALTLKNVEGATLAIIDKSSGEELVQWVTTKEDRTFERYLNDGVPLNVNTTYVLRELDAPEGYERAGDTDFHIDAYGSVVIESGSDAEARSGAILYLYDSKLIAEQTVYEQGQNNGTPTNNGNGNGGSDASKMLQTGDVVRIALIAALALAAAVVLFAALSLRRKRRGSDAS